MSRRIRSTAVAVLASLALVTMGSTASLAQEVYPPDGAFGVTCVSAGQAGASVTCTVVGANAGEQLAWSAAYGSTQIASGVLTANAEGVASFRFTAPVQARGQAITVTVTREDGTSTASTEITIAAPGRTGQVFGQSALAYTGQDAILLGAGGLILLAGGVLALRRRGASNRIDA